MGLATIDPHRVKEHAEFHEIPKFGVNRPNNRRHRTAVRHVIHLTFSNGCILLIIGSI